MENIQENEVAPVSSLAVSPAVDAGAGLGQAPAAEPREEQPEGREVNPVGMSAAQGSDQPPPEEIEDLAVEEGTGDVTVESMGAQEEVGPEDVTLEVDVEADLEGGVPSDAAIGDVLLAVAVSVAAASSKTSGALKPPRVKTEPASGTEPRPAVVWPKRPRRAIADRPVIDVLVDVVEMEDTPTESSAGPSDEENRGSGASRPVPATRRLAQPVASVRDHRCRFLRHRAVRPGQTGSRRRSALPSVR
jgi:hypothetical protein